MSREGVEPSPSAFGEPCSGPVELPQPKLCEPPRLLLSTINCSMHRAGLEPTFLRLKGGGSAIELPVRALRMHREGFEPSADPLEEGCSKSVELPVPS